jgi:hypothetical protein
MAPKHDGPENSRDTEDAELLRAVRELVEKAGLKNVRGIGPINAERTCIKILLADDGHIDLPERIEATLSNKRTLGLKLDIVRNAEPARLLLGPMPQPWQYSGPMMGGDPIWNDVARQWGTITFAAAAGSPVEIEGKSCANQSVTCSHVLYFNGPDDVSTTLYSQSMKLGWATDPPNGTKWIDLAGADIRAGVPFSSLEVRGLRHIKGCVQPQAGIRVSKYGATTGLTSGRDLGWATRKIQVGTKVYDIGVRAVSGYFAREGDSGAPVLDADRNFLGLVVSGRPGVLDDCFYLPAVPVGQTQPTPASSGISDPSYFEIDGL